MRLQIWLLSTLLKLIIIIYCVHTFFKEAIVVKNTSNSLIDLLGTEYCEVISKTAMALHAMPEQKAKELISAKVDFFPADYSERIEALTGKIGEQVFEAFENDNMGASLEGYNKVTKRSAAPIGCIGPFRIGEDGRLYLAAKSEHYHIPIGHNFPGYKLINYARELGIPNATHNNTRGYITRKLERRIVGAVNDVEEGSEELDKVLSSKEPKVLNRLLNIETGSLACEAGIKILLTRFYQQDNQTKPSVHQGKVPVFLVIADNTGGLEANYHGTTITAQTLRGLWPGLYKKTEKSDIYKIVSVKINDINDFEEKIKKYNKGKYKTAGFLHEIVLMNYGAVLLDRDYLLKTYELCGKYDTPTFCDEIQSCMWYPGMFLFKIYGLKPDIVILGKGFSGGEYPASRMVTTYEMDSMGQFGALVTNGQQELASLAYLITMRFFQANKDEIGKLGAYIEELLDGLKRKYPGVIDKIEGKGHLLAIHFYSLEYAGEFAKRVNRLCIDISAQTYKPNCPPAALIKLPVIMSENLLKTMADKFDGVINEIEKEK